MILYGRRFSPAPVSSFSSAIMGRQGCEVTTHIVKRDHIHQTVTLVFSPGSQRNKVSLCQVEIALVSVSVCEAGGLKSIYFVWKAQTACCQAEEQAGGSLFINYYWKALSQHWRCEIMPSAYVGLWFTLWQLPVLSFCILWRSKTCAKNCYDNSVSLTKI